jgi:hypothetical protein
VATPKPATLARREFLVLGSVAAAGVAASSLSAGTIRGIAAPADGPVLSVGFTDAFERAGKLHTVVRRSAGLRAAGRLRFADAGFRDGGARLTVHGLWEPRDRDAAPASVRVTAFFPHETPAGRVPFLAWTGTAGAARRPNRTGRTSFVAPLDSDGTLPLAFERVEQPSSIVRRLTSLFASDPAADALPSLELLESKGGVCRLSSGDRGDLRLRRGTYFIALRQSQRDGQPDWRAIAIDGEHLDLNGAGALRQGGQPVGFSYVVVSVDHVA